MSWRWKETNRTHQIPAWTFCGHEENHPEPGPGGGRFPERRVLGAAHGRGPGHRVQDRARPAAPPLPRRAGTTVSFATPHEGLATTRTVETHRGRAATGRAGSAHFLTEMTKRKKTLAAMPSARCSVRTEAHRQTHLLPRNNADTQLSVWHVAKLWKPDEPHVRPSSRNSCREQEHHKRKNQPNDLDNCPETALQGPTTLPTMTVWKRTEPTRPARANHPAAPMPARTIHPTCLHSNCRGETCPAGISLARDMCGVLLVCRRQTRGGSRTRVGGGAHHTNSPPRNVRLLRDSGWGKLPACGKFSRLATSGVRGASGTVQRCVDHAVRCAPWSGVPSTADVSF